MTPPRPAARRRADAMPSATPPHALRTDAADGVGALVAVIVPVLIAALTLLVSPAAARAEPTPPWAWPLPPPAEVLAPFDVSAGPYGPGHRGIDLVGASTEVRAVDDGVVRFAGPVAGRGTVSVLHADGLISTYEPVDPVVAVGDRVPTGTVLGTLQGSAGAASHCAPRLCLHLGARRGEVYLDPMLLLRPRGPSVLLPLAGGGATAGGIGAGGAGGAASGPAASGAAGRAARAVLVGTGPVTATAVDAQARG
ncbi:murein hydrolase activator EnvC family protein [Brachybacterium huguangmaarense]